jgi:carbonic anhydrase
VVTASLRYSGNFQRRDDLSRRMGKIAQHLQPMAASESSSRSSAKDRIRAMSVDPSPAYTADEALARLVAGNERFVRGEARFPTVQKELLAALAKGQHPYATVLGCSDSRVPPELIFDAGFGELFIIRVAGNVISPEVMGTLQFAAVHLHTPLFVVLGHEGCGAVGAALAARNGAQEPARISLLLDDILPGLRDLPSELAPDEAMRTAVEANVRWSMQQLVETPEAKTRLREGTMKLVGGVYELESGCVRFLP